MDLTAALHQAYHLSNNTYCISKPPHNACGLMQRALATAPWLRFTMQDELDPVITYVLRHHLASEHQSISFAPTYTELVKFHRQLHVDSTFIADHDSLKYEHDHAKVSRIRREFIETER